MSERILMPDTSTLANRKVVIPPSTQSGMVVKNAPTFAMIPALQHPGLSFYADQ